MGRTQRRPSFRKSCIRPDSTTQKSLRDGGFSALRELPGGGRTTAQKGLAGGLFHQIIRSEGKQDRGGVGDPRIECGEVQPASHMVEADHVDEVEVQQKEAVAGLAEQHQRPPGED